MSLEAANTPGSSPFMESTTSADLPRRLNRLDDTSLSNQTVSGDQIGLYGGSTNLAICDRDKMVGFLDSHPVQAGAWRTAAEVPDIHAYVSKLSPLVLLRDTRVTNHGFENGAPTTFQSVLQTGTAVLVDDRGVPRVRCDSGSPLDEPQSGASEKFSGTGWQGLETDQVVKVQRAEAPIKALTVVPLPEPRSPSPTSEEVSDGPTSADEPGPVETETKTAPMTLLAEMPVGETFAKPAQTKGLPAGVRVVAVDVAPPLGTGPSSTTPITTTPTTDTPTTTTPTTTTATTTTPTTTTATTTTSTTTTATTTTPTTTTVTTTTPTPGSSTPSDSTPAEPSPPTVEEPAPTWEETPFPSTPIP